MTTLKQEENSYYDLNAKAFIESTLKADMTEHYAKFLAYIPKHGSILDAGCGSGRDSKNFQDIGYQVEAFDISIEMVKFATQYTGIEVKHHDFISVEEDIKFDGIWACASLLHVSCQELIEILAKYKSVLKPQGVMYMSFKYGTDHYTKNGREFYCYTEETINDLIKQVGDYDVLESYVTGDVRNERSEEKWTSIIIRLKNI